MPNIKTDDILQTAEKQVDACLLYRQSRLDEIKKSEDAYFCKTKPALKGRFNIPLPIAEGFVETSMSKIDDQIKVVFKRGREATLKAAKKITAAWEKDSAPDRGDFNGADLDAKKLAHFSGFGTLKLVAGSTPYFQKLVAVDYYDLIFEPHGGRDLDDHLFKGQLNIFKTKEQLIQGVKAGWYDKSQVTTYLIKINQKDTKTFQGQQEEKYQRYSAMNLNPKNYNFVGTVVGNFTELITRIDDEDYYILFDKENKHWIKIAPVEEVFPKGFSPYVAWQTERSPISFLCRAPLDSVRPVYEAMRLLLNQNLDNIQKRNWDMVLFNAKKIINPSQLEYRPHGLISVKLKDGESMASAYAKMETPDTSTITINLLQWFSNFTGQQKGVTPGAQGVAEEETLGIYYGNMQQVADRFGLINKFYAQSHVKVAQRYKANLGKFMPPRDYMVKFVGLEEALTKDEVAEDMEVQVISSATEAKNSLVVSQKKQGALTTVLNKPELLAQTNPKFILEEVLRNGEYAEEEIKAFTDKEGSHDSILMSEAAKAIEDILMGKTPKLNRGANLNYVKKIRNYAVEEENLTDKEFVDLMSFAMQHLEIAQKNEMEEQMFTAKQQPLASVLPPTPVAGPSPTLVPTGTI